MPTLSLCMIVRDEAENLGRAIDSFQGVADEVVVVDTGSTDGTVEVALEQGARVVHHPWADDFSAARNAGFDACAGDWVFGLDADERLVPESARELRRIVAEGSAQAYQVTRRDLMAEGFSEMRFVRLGRRDAGRCMVGRIHERFEPPLTDIKPSGIVIEHDGYLPGRNEVRLWRNVRLLELELSDRPDQAYYLADLTHAYWLLGDPRWVEALRRTARLLDLASPRPPIPLALPLLEIVLAAPEDMLPEGLSHAGGGVLAERWYPRSVPLLVMRARLAFSQSDFAAAVELGERALNLWESDDYDRTVSFDPAIVGADLRLNLGVALAQTGRLKESLRRFEEATQDARYAAVAYQNTAAIRAALAC